MTCSARLPTRGGLLKDEADESLSEILERKASTKDVAEDAHE